MTKTATLSLSRFEALDSWRGICALLVALLHFKANTHLREISFFQNSFLFVDFFFVLSGFVIAANYQQRLGEGFGLGRFMLLRFGRIYPLYGAMLLAFIGFEVLQVIIPSLGAMGATAPFSAPRQSADTIFASVFLLQSFGAYDFLTWNTPGWSIATEFWTYLLFGLVMTHQPRATTGIASALLVVCMLILLSVSPQGMNTTYDFGMLRCVAGFGAGVIAHALWLRWGRHLTVTQNLGTALELITLAVIVIFVARLGRSDMAVLAPVVFAISVLVFAAESGRISALLRLKPFLLLGTLSYSIYLVHLFIETRLLNVASLVQSKTGFMLYGKGLHEGVEVKLLGVTPLQGDLWCVAMLAIVLAVSWVSYRLIEVPGRDWFRALAQPKARALALQV